MLRRSSLKRSAMPKRRKPVGVIVADVWRNGMESACAMCGTRGVRLDGHHAVYAQTLKRHGLHAFLMDTRNRVALCRDCHVAHHNRSRPLTREQLPASVFEFAAEVELTWWLERRYPEAVAA